MSLRARLRPWHGLMVLTFLAGAAVSLSQADEIRSWSAFVALVAGLLAVVVLQFSVGNVWGYAVEYANAGGSWTDVPFLAPFAAVLVGIGAVLAIRGSVFAALWTGFWLFVITAALVALVVRFYVGYAEVRS